ncbi:MAG: ATP-binding protein [Candidatus Nanopelagicales bacterium]
MTKRLVIAMTALVALVAIALAVPLAIIVANDQRDQFISRLEVATLSAASVLSSQPRELWANETQDIHEATGARVIVVGTDAKLIADSSDSALDRAFDRPEINKALEGYLTTDVRASSTLGTDLRYVAAPVVQNQQVSGAVRLSIPEDEVTSVVRSTQKWLLLFVISVMAVAAVVAWLLARSIASPLRRLADVAHALPDDLALRASETDGPAEVRSVASALNTTAGKLDGILARTERVAADASHHLRTPLFGVRLRLEAIEDITTDDAVRAEAIAATAEVDRLTHRIDQVLSLARTDSGSTTVRRMNASTKVSGRIIEAELIANENEIELTGDIAPDLWIMSTEGTVAKITDELLGNAMSYASSRIHVTLRREGRDVVLAVGDDGPGLAAAERESVFQRFTRGSAAVPGGSGLGLALVQESARAAGGDATAQQSPLGGLEVRVSFPAAD